MEWNAQVKRISIMRLRALIVLVTLASLLTLVPAAQADTLIEDAVPVEVTTEPVTSFGDLPIDALFAYEVAWLADAGITKGCNPPGNDMFCPDAPVTRGQMAAFLVRAFGYSDRGSTDFIDDDGSIFEADIERLAAAGVTKGCNPPGNDMFCPDAPVTRGQMAAFLHRAFGGPAPWTLRYLTDISGHAVDVDDQGRVLVILYDEDMAGIWDTSQGRLTRLQSEPGAQGYAYSMSNSGYVTGTESIPSDPSGVTYVWDPNGRRMHTFQGINGELASPMAVNDSGTVVGLTDVDNRMRAFAWSIGDADITLLETPAGESSYAIGVAADGHVAGDSGERAVIWDTNGEAEFIPLDASYAWSAVGSVAPSGFVLGVASTVAFGEGDIFVWKIGSLSAEVLLLNQLESLFPSSIGFSASAADVNDQGLVVGSLSYETSSGVEHVHMFYWNSQTDELVFSPTGEVTGRLVDMNSDGVAALTGNADTSFPAIWATTTNTVTPFWVRGEGGDAEGINESGTVAGWYSPSDNTFRPSVWIPPEVR